MIRTVRQKFDPILDALQAHLSVLPRFTRAQVEAGATAYQAERSAE